ncbi:MAG: hypothetical protein C4B59_05555 [Candidatus Methanogaster sp.]|uniref:Uncharacterized protein n=1 Tax=Candidatus Methanogaster sp. TaxID=3386292 RepID=A0AC61L4E3_9EURY|nr:MAG: hypothetical protein C4B59_05555 [ANME-2 cluster archaeon]
MKYEISELVNIDKVQVLADSFCEAVGIASAVIDLEGNVVTSSRWQKICTEFHRVNPQTCRKCIESDTILANRLTKGEGYAIYRCRNGLVDAAAPILIDGEHVANFLVGQFLFEPADCEYFRKQAREHGFDETTYLEALSGVPVIAEDRIKPILEFLVGFAEFVGEMGLSRIRQLEDASALAESNEKYLEAIIKTSRDGIFVVDADGNFKFGNDATFEILGWPMEELIGNPLMKVIPLDVHEFILQRWDEVQRGEGGPYGVDIVTKDRERRSLFVSHSLMDIVGQRKYCVIIKDVTERKAEEESLRQSEENYRTIFDAANDAIYIHDITFGDIIDVNQKMCEMHGCTPAEARSLNVGDFSAGEPPYAQEDAMQWIRKASEEGPQLFEWRSKDLSGRLFWTEVNLKRVVIKGEDRLLAIVRDISERKSTEERLKKYREHLEELVEDRTGELQREIGERKVADERTAHLNLVLRAIRNVNQLVTKEPDRDRLLRGACDNLIETCGYHNAWIALLDESGTPVTTAEAGLGEAFVPMIKRLKHGELVECARKAFAQSGVVVIDDPAATCADCPLMQRYDGRRAMIIRLEHGGTVYGLFSVAVPAKLAADREEQALFKEVAGDIAFALYNLEQEAERGGAEGALTESEKKLSQIVNGSSTPIFVIDRTHTVTHWNKACENLTGVSAEEMVGTRRQWSPFYSTERLVLADVIVDESTEEEIARYYGGKFRKSALVDGAYEVEDFFPVFGDKWLFFTAAPIRDARGDMTGAIESLWDITEHKRTEKALRESEEKYRVLFETAKDAIFLNDETGRFIDVNSAACESLGYDREELLKMSNKEIDADPRGYEAFMKVRDGLAKEAVFEVNHKMKDGTLVPVEVSGKVLDCDGSRIFMAIARDITDRKRAEKKLKRVMADLKRSNTDLEQFAYVVSHDLQEPLRMVSSYVQLLSKRYSGKLDSDADDFIGFAADGASRMHTLIQDLLRYSRVGTRGKPPTPVACEDALNHALANLKLTIEDSDAVVTHDPLPTVAADSSQLAELFQNLIGNAIKFRGEEPSRVHVAVEQKEDKWIFSVADNGIGISPEYFDRIFVIFQRLHGREDYSGTGIGLAVCKKIVERHGGQMWVESEPGRGATFFFTIQIEDQRLERITN